MVKGTSKQVIVVHAPEQKLFEQAIFILKDGAVGEQGITDEALMKEARQYINLRPRRTRHVLDQGPVWAAGGAAVTGLCWLLSLLL